MRCQTFVHSQDQVIGPSGVHTSWEVHFVEWVLISQTSRAGANRERIVNQDPAVGRHVGIGIDILTSRRAAHYHGNSTVRA